MIGRMRCRLLLPVLLVVLLAAPGAAGAQLVVAGSSTDLGAPSSTTITFDGATPAALVVYVPLGFTVNLGQAPGTALGTASATLDSRGTAVTAEGSVLVADSAVAACGSTGHQAVWRLSLAGAPSEVLLAVDGIAPGDPAADYASHRLGLCAGDGVLVRQLELRIEGVFANPSAADSYAWRAVATPADPAGALIPSGAVESRSTQFFPVRLTLRGSFDRADGEARLTGTVSAGGSALAGARIAIAAGRAGSSLVRAGSATTGDAGRFEEQRRIVEATVFEASVDMPTRNDPAGCPAPIAPAGCSGATLGAFHSVSERVTVRVPAPRVLRLGSHGSEVRRLKAELVRLRFLPPGANGATFDERTWHAVVALQGWLRRSRTGVVDRGTWRALARARTPVPWAPIRRGVLIDTARQVLLLVDGGHTVRAIHVSTGAYGRTPRGRFAVYRKETLSWSVPFSVWMPYASYFNGGFAMHAYPSVPAYPASHGCVRLPPVEAPGVYRFAGYGTPVWVR
jgi:L,D-transpeptidase catalytic domain/Putative peptidoglycan binding domain